MGKSSKSVLNPLDVIVRCRRVLCATALEVGAEEKGINGQELLDFSFGGVRTTEDSVHIWKETSLNDTCLDYSSTFQRICNSST